MERTVTRILLSIVLFFSACQEQEFPIRKGKLNKIEFTSLDKELVLNRAIELIGLNKKSSSSGRLMSGLAELKADSILKVLQDDSVNYTYTLSIDEPAAKKSFRNLIFKRVEKGFFAFVLEYVTEDPVFNFQSFSGTVKRYDLQGLLLDEVRLTNAKFANSSGRTMACLADVVVECVSERFGGWDHTTGKAFSECEAWATIITIDCFGGSGGGAGSSRGWSNPGTYVPDPWAGGGGGSGGGSGSGGSGSTNPPPSGGYGGTNPPPSNDPSFEGNDPIGVLPKKPDIQGMINLWEDEQIFDSHLKPCMQTIMTDLKNLTQGSVGQIVKKFSGSVPGYNWEVKDGSLVGSQNAFTNQAYNKATGTVTTTFDGNKFTNSTELSIARTILHESVHAYLIAYFRVDALSARSSYPDLVNDYAQQNYGGDANQIQHAEFVRNFVSEIAIALEEYGRNRGYGHSTQFYQDLAWGGLIHTGTYDAMGNPNETKWFQNSIPSTTDRKRIVDTVTIEQTGNDLSGTTKTQKGTNAGC